MEWLSHSQKKYCELCKTPFRFTKLYSPDMPQSLPMHIFAKHMARYLFSNLLVWLRAAVAISVWVFWLPYFMRAVWSFMFWISDEGLGGSIISRINETNSTMSAIPSSILAIGTCPASPLLAATTTSAAEVEAVVGQLEGKDVSDYFMRFLLNSFTSPLLASDAELGYAANASAALNNASQFATTTTLLSDVGVLGNLTRNASLNRAVVSVLEGQIITVLVIISFILIILVRDYVVQQQPEINMRAAFAAPENDIQVPEPAEIIQPENLPPVNLHPTDSDDETLEDSDQVGDQDWQRVPPGRLAPAGGEALTPDSSNHSTPDHDSFPTSSTNTSLQNDQLNSHAREDADEGEAAEEPTSLDDYQRIYGRANGDLQDMLRIIEEEGLQEKLKYWVEFTRRSASTIENTSRGVTSEPATDEADQEHPEHEIDSDHDTLQSFSIWKGKEPWSPTQADADVSGPSDTPEDELFGVASRPRSMSDGLQGQFSTNPLANNSWSFDALPVDDKPDESFQALSAIQEQFAQDFTGDEPSGGSSGQSQDSGDEDDSYLSREAYRRLSDGDTYQRHPPREIQQPLPDLNERQQRVDAEIETQPPHANGATEEAAVNGGDAPAAGFADKVADFMWGNMDDLDPPVGPRALIVAAHQAALDDMAVEEAVERAAGQEAAAGNNNREDLWVDVPAEPNGDDGEGIAADDNAAPLDPEAIEDMEDFEGVMELIGMRGPIAGLFQNAIFCAVLVSVTVFACIFIPYNIGRVSVWLLASPMRVVRLLFELSKLLQDATFLVGGLGSWCALNFVDIFAAVMGGSVKAHIVSARKMSWGLWTGAASRICTFLFKDFFPMSATEIHNFSAVSHDALNIVKGNVVSVFSNISGSLTTANAVGFDKIMATTMTLLSSTSETAIKVSSLLTKPSSWVIDLSLAEEWPLLDPQLTYWSSLDRFWAILAGYTTMFLIGALYLKKGSPFSRNAIVHAWETGVIESLQQASGIMKVILIISIEMLVFPLYCGLLLDAALLPLFEDTTFTSRIIFTCKYPMTSVFVHWFVGTGYMFHFALFVSMCRKIMRPGVLCEFFIASFPSILYLKVPKFS